MSNLVKKEIEITAFKSVYYFEHGKEFYHRPEQHNFWELVFVDKGARLYANFIKKVSALNLADVL